MNESALEQPCGTPVVGRYAPSPSGEFHLGNLRTALLAWVYARAAQGRFVLRIEDLDERSRPEHEAAQLRALETLGIFWDGEAVRQSERLQLYGAVCESLLESGALYECYCTRRELAHVARAPHQPPGSYPGTCRNLSPEQRNAGREKLAGARRFPALRLRVEVEGSCSAEKGVSAAQCSEYAAAYGGYEICDANYGAYCGSLDDLVVKRGDGVYSYNFASVVDDGEMGVTQIVRGDDLLPSTPRQVYLQRLLGYVTPEYRHVPLVVNSSGVRLAKRDGAVTLSQLEQLGWESADVIELLAASLGYGCAAQKIAPWARNASGVCCGRGDSGLERIRTVQDFLAVFDPERCSGSTDLACMARKPWVLDVDVLVGGPQAVLR